MRTVAEVLTLAWIMLALLGVPAVARPLLSGEQRASLVREALALFDQSMASRPGDPARAAALARQSADAWQTLIDATLDEGLAPAAAVYLNLGNARFEAGQLGEAIAAYRQAQRLAPGDQRVRENLRVALRRAGLDPNHADEPPTPPSMLASVVSWGWFQSWSLSARTWALLMCNLALWTLVGAWLSLRLRLFARGRAEEEPSGPLPSIEPSSAQLYEGAGLLLDAPTLARDALRRLQRERLWAQVLWWAAAAFAVLVVALGLSVLVERVSPSLGTGVTIVGDVPVRAGNGEGFALRFDQKLPEATEFAVLEVRANWWHIRLRSGQDGWIEQRHGRRVYDRLPPTESLAND